MVEDYYLKPDTIDRIRASWLGEPIERYVAWLAEQGYAARNVYRRVPMLMHFAQFSAARGAKNWEDLPEHVEAFVAAWSREHGRHCKTKEAKRQVAGAARVPVEQMVRLLLPSGARAMAAPMLVALAKPLFCSARTRRQGTPKMG